MRLNSSWEPEQLGGFRRTLICAIQTLLWLVCFGCLGQAQDQEHSIRVWQVEDGLPQNSVTSIIQTPEGYLWLATFNGLARFDGARFSVFDEGNTPILQSSRLVRLDLDPGGGLWIITEDGALTRLKDGQFTPFNRLNGLPEAGAAAVICGPKKRVLLVDRAGGVGWLDGDRWVPERRCELLRGSRVSLFVDEEDSIWAWFHDNRTLGRIDADRLELLQQPDGAVNAQVRAYALSRDGGLWVVLADRVWHYDYRRRVWRPTPWQLPKPAAGLTHMLEDRRGDVWLGTYGGGLLRLAHSGLVTQLTVADGLSHDAVRALCEDREGNIWAGTDGGGLIRLKPRVIGTFDVQQGLTAPVVMSITPDRAQTNALWVGLNGGGVNHLERGHATALIAEPLLRTNTHVYSVFTDRQDGLWIGTYDSGILRYSQGEVTALPGTEHWGGQPLLTGLEDRSGAVWQGGAFALVRWRKDGFTNFNAELGHSNLVVRALAEDQAGDLYVGSFGHGLSRCSQGHWTRYLEADGLSDKHISALYVDGENTLWIGTFNGGLCRFSHDRFHRYTIHDGLPANCIGCILEDGKGNLWFGSNRGIFRIRKAQLNQVAEGLGQDVTAYVYGIGNGLKTLECGLGAKPGACQGPDGKLWFATVRGVAVLDPGKLPFNPLPPPMVIEEILLDEKPVVSNRAAEDRGRGRADTVPERQDSAPPTGLPRAPSGILRVPPGKHRLEFRFTGLSLVTPEQVQFRYRLLGLDEDWVEGGPRRSAFYSYVPPGKYSFEVTACNNDGVWNPSAARVAFVVLPPWWKTWWVLVLALVGTGAGVFWLAELRLRRLRHERGLQAAFAQRLLRSQEDERTRIAAELHDSLGQNLLVIKNRALLALRETSGKSRPEDQFTEISHIATETIESVREISRNLRPYQLDRLGLTKAIEIMAASVSESAGLPCVTKLDATAGLLPKGSEIHLFRIVQELLNNVVKHSGAAGVQITLKQMRTKLLLTVGDDGRGFDYQATFQRPAHQHGLGLSDLSERVRILNGTLHCDTRPGHGTSWRIDIPINNRELPGSLPER